MQIVELVIDGADRRKESEVLVKGVDLLVATHGWLLAHLQGTSGFVFRNLKFLVIDEANRTLEHNLRRLLKRILAICRKRDELLFFSY